MTEQIATSRYASGLHPVTSMLTLRLYQHESYDPLDDRILIDVDPRSREIIVQYTSGPKPQRQSLALESRWVRRGADGFALFERCVRHLRWFVDHTPAPR